MPPTRWFLFLSTLFLSSSCHLSKFPYVSRYYYAVAIFDSSATANHVYNTLDGTELTRTSNVFDLRFIPDSMEFKHPPRDATTEVQ